jgi:hypothetical protein
VQLYHVDESFVEKFYSEWSGIVDKDAHAEDFSFQLRGECTREFGRAVSFGGGPEIDSKGIHFQVGQSTGIIQRGDATDFE